MSLDRPAAIYEENPMARTHCESITQVITPAFLLLVCFFAIGAWAAPAPQNEKSLRIYFVDVEGGQATLFVTPAGQSLLIDTGWPGNDGRDADRIDQIALTLSCTIFSEDGSPFLGIVQKCRRGSGVG